MRRLSRGRGGDELESEEDREERRKSWKLRREVEEDGRDVSFVWEVFGTWSS